MRRRSEPTPAPLPTPGPASATAPVDDDDRPPRHLRWEGDAWNSLEAARYWAAKPGWGEWVEAVYRVHRRKVLDLFEKYGFYAEAVEMFDPDPDLRAHAAVVREERRARFDRRYGHLRSHLDHFMYDPKEN